MTSKNSQSETIKEAVTAATRAISGNKELEINFGGMGSSPVSYTHLTLPTNREV